MENAIKKYKNNITRYYHRTPTGSTYGTFWKNDSLWFTAGHVLTQFGMYTPDFVEGNFKHRLKGLDISVAGLDNFCPVEYDKVHVGQRVVAMGFPAGSRNLETRVGWVHIERPNNEGVWIAGVKRPCEPVVSGMSGGMILGENALTGKWSPVGVLITRNSPTDLDRDGKADETFDFVSIEYALRNNDNSDIFV